MTPVCSIVNEELDIGEKIRKIGKTSETSTNVCRNLPKGGQICPYPPGDKRVKSNAFVYKQNEETKLD